MDNINASITPDIRVQLERLLEYSGFSGSPRLSRFLRLIVEEELAGRGNRINGTQFAIEVFDRDQSFDPSLDPIVRMEARRLRRVLEKYFLT